MMAGPAVAQSNGGFVVQFTGFLGDLRFAPDQLRAELVGDEEDVAQVAVALDGDAATAFAQFTRTHMNQPVTMFICGAQVASPVIRQEITTGFSISGPIEREVATQMVDALNGLGDCPE